MFLRPIVVLIAIAAVGCDRVTLDLKGTDSAAEGADASPTTGNPPTLGVSDPSPRGDSDDDETEEVDPNPGAEPDQGTDPSGGFNPPSGGGFEPTDGEPSLLCGGDLGCPSEWPYCEPSLGCVQCLDNDDCRRGEVCQTYTCIPHCDDDSECAPNEQCHDNRCYECDDQGDDAEEGDAHCFQWYEDRAVCHDLRCVECTSPTHCLVFSEDRPACTRWNECVECTDNTHCLLQERRRTCDRSRNECVECLSDYDCLETHGPGDQAVCEQTRCGPCSAEHPCQPPFTCDEGACVYDDFGTDGPFVPMPTDTDSMTNVVEAGVDGATDAGADASVSGDER